MNINQVIYKWSRVKSFSSLKGVQVICTGGKHVVNLIPITCGNNGWRFARVSKVPNKSNGVKRLEISVSILIDASCTTPLSSASPCQPSKTYTNFIWWLVLFLSTSTTALCMMRRNGYYLDKWLNWALIEICSSPAAILWSKLIVIRLDK